MSVRSAAELIASPSLSVSEVPRRDDADAAAIEACMRTGQPFVVTGRFAAARARPAWEIDLLASHLGHVSVPAQVSRTGRFLPDPDRGFQTRMVTLREYHDYLTEPAPSEHLYVMHMDTDQVFGGPVPPIERAMALPGNAPSSIRVWISRAGTVTPLHYDMPSNWLMQVTGRKLVVLAPPRALGLLRPYPIDSRWANYSGVDLDDLDGEQAAPLCDAGFQVAELDPGDALCIPSFWWHYVRTLTTGISVNRWWRSPARMVAARSLGRAAASAGLFGRAERMVEFLDFGDERWSAHWLPDHLWASGEPVYAVVAAGSAVVGALRERENAHERELLPGTDGTDGRQVRDLLALVEACREPAHRPPHDQLEAAFVQLRALIDGLCASPKVRSS